MNILMSDLAKRTPCNQYTCSKMNRVIILRSKTTDSPLKCHMRDHAGVNDNC